MRTLAIITGLKNRVCYLEEELRKQKELADFWFFKFEKERKKKENYERERNQG